MNNNNVLDDIEFGSAPQSPLEIKPNKARAGQTITALHILLGTQIVSIISYLMLYFSSKPSYDPLEIVDLEEIRRTVFFSSIAYVLNMVAVLSMGICFARWFYRAYSNLHTMYDHLSCERYWAVLGWLIPVINLYRPYAIMKEMYRLTANYLHLSAPDENKANLSLDRVSLWWSLLLTRQILVLMGLGFLNSGKINTYGISQNGAVFSILLTIFSIVNALITLRLVKQYSIAEELMRTTAEKIALTEDMENGNNPSTNMG